MTLPRVVVDVTNTPGGNWTVQVRPPGAPDPAVAALAAYPLPDLPTGTAGAGYGRRLFACLLAPAWAAIRALPEVAANHGVEIALRWPADSPLHRYVWEAMHDGTAPLVGHPELTVAITRLVPCPTPAPDMVGRVPRALMVSGAALTDPVVRPGAMFLGLAQSMRQHGTRVATAAQPVSVHDLAERCATVGPDIVALVAHGELVEGRGVVLLRDDLADAERLATALTAGGRPAVAVLAACSSGAAGTVGVADGAAPLAAELVRRGIPIVAAMAGDVSEPACRLYVRQLLTALQNGAPLAEASAHGRRAALLKHCPADDRLDWALPTLFVAESVPAGYRVVDPAPTGRLLAAADMLGLRVKPVYIERPGVFEPVDQLFDLPLRVVVYGNERSIAGLGGTRLLREAGMRLLCAGHVPLLLGPYAPSTEPADLRAIVGELYERAVLTGHALGLPGADLVALFERLRDFRTGAEPLEPVAVRSRLAEAIAGLARLAAGLGDPFGGRSRVVVLADEVHRWPGAGALLDLAERGGLGLDPPAPLVATASFAAESPVKGFREEHQNRFDHRFPTLSTLAPAEARLGFEWVLLHPWREQHPDSYTRAPHGSPEKIALSLDKNGDKPTAVAAEMFYVIAELLEIHGHFVRGDDEAAFRAYEERQR